MILGPRTKGGGTESNTALGLVARRIVVVVVVVVDAVVVSLLPCNFSSTRPGGMRGAIESAVPLAACWTFSSNSYSNSNLSFYLF